MLQHPSLQSAVSPQANHKSICFSHCPVLQRPHYNQQPVHRPTTKVYVFHIAMCCNALTTISSLSTGQPQKYMFFTLPCAATPLLQSAVCPQVNHKSICFSHCPVLQRPHYNQQPVHKPAPNYTCLRLSGIALRMVLECFRHQSLSRHFLSA
jgi:hypothetical protein